MFENERSMQAQTSPLYVDVGLLVITLCGTAGRYQHFMTKD
jgi:hypothetical protein